MPLSLRSTAFVNEASIPRKHTGDGADLSPPLAWIQTPRATRALALVCDDPDAPGGIWTHWVLYDLPAAISVLPEGLPRARVLGNGARQGRTSWGTLGYRGPLPPPGGGRHRYYFQLYALSEPTGLEAGATREEVLEAIRDRVLAKALLMGTYQR